MSSDSYYAVRQGKDGLRSCIFLSYKDCKKYLDGYRRAKFETFGNLEDAALYLSTTTEKKPRRARDQSTQYIEWHSNFKLLQAYNEENGNCDVPRDVNSPLSNWVFQQIREYRKIKTFQCSQLTLGRVQLLIDEGFNFHRAKTMSWKDSLVQLREFKKRFKKTNVPKTHPQLGPFVARQRTEYKRWVEGKTSTMTEKRRQDLEELGFTFPKRKSSKNIETKTWDESFLDLLQFRDVYGHVFVPPSYPQLGQWVTNQRKSYKEFEVGNKFKLTQDQVSKLVDVRLFEEREMKYIPEDELIEV